MIPLKTERTALHPPSVDLAGRVLEYRRSNRKHLAPWEPDRDEEHYTIWQCRADLQRDRTLFINGQALCFWALHDQSGAVVGMGNFTNIVRDPFHACNLGYSIDRAHEGQGYMREIVQAGLDHVFSTLDLHRVLANHLPENTRSARLLERLGFEREGLARSCMIMGGRWRDQVLTAKINPGHEEGVTPAWT